MKRYQYSLAGLFFLTTAACVLFATLRDSRVFVAFTVLVVAALVLATVTLFASLGEGDDVPDLDE